MRRIRSFVPTTSATASTTAADADADADADAQAQAQAQAQASAATAFAAAAAATFADIPAKCRRHSAMHRCPASILVGKPNLCRAARQREVCGAQGLWGWHLLADMWPL